MRFQQQKHSLEIQSIYVTQIVLGKGKVTWTTDKEQAGNTKCELIPP